MTAKEFYEKNQIKRRMYCLKTGTFCDIIGYHLEEDKILVAIIPNPDDIIEGDKAKEDLKYFQETNFYFIDLNFLRDNLKEIIDVEIAELSPALFWNGSGGRKYYYNIYNLFNDCAIYTRTGRQLNLSFCLKQYIGSVLIEQDKNQEDKSLYYLYIRFKGKEILEVFSANDIFKFILDVVDQEDTSKIEEIIDILAKKDDLLLEAFLGNKHYHQIIKDALAYRYYGLVENKVKRKETEVLGKLFKELNCDVSIDEKGNIKYSKKL